MLNEQFIREILREFLYQKKVTLLRFFSTDIFSFKAGKLALLHAVNKLFNSVARRRQIVNLWHLIILMDSDCSGMWGGT